MTDRPEIALWIWVASGVAPIRIPTPVWIAAIVVVSVLAGWVAHRITRKRAGKS
jgi:hypothetical protein